MLFQVLCGFEPIFYTTHPNEESFFIVNSIPEGRLRSMGRHADSARSIFDESCMSYMRHRQKVARKILVQATQPASYDKGKKRV